MTLVASGVAQAQAPSGYEKEPVLSAKGLAAPELLRGPHFTVDPKIPVRGFIARFTIRSPFGTFEAYGLRMLPIRVNEVAAIAKLDEFSKTREFAAAVGWAAARPVTSAANMVARPVETVAGFPDGAARLFGRIRLAGERIAEAATAPGQSPGERTAGASRLVGTAAITALGFEQEHRSLAQRLGVPAPVVYVSWIEPLERAVARPEFQSPDKVAFLSGQLSPLARKNLASRGWRTDELYTIAAER